MNIEKTENGTEVTLALSGRLDTVTAPQLEEKVQESLAGTQMLVMDFQDLEYLSSAGLRVLLTAHKAMMKSGGKLEIRHVNEVIHEVFEVTGFLDVLNIA
ncbi:MAG: STAS domain-containing protein [Bacteroidales bacterium]|nr:STAS domain-containing protein [Ruminococcus flavefaciens]MCM1267732.1 STAS domain-containing protein [Bacteroidales bacterium]MCM1414894.1 STAS domain-containing protein [bacterium]MCM1423935.1 STAS domain-containing protein [bacterium]